MCAGLGRYRILGETLDDAAGEAFDKTAKMLGLPYPGGAALAQSGGDRDAAAASTFPRPMLDRPGLDFSFSGLKTAALVALRGRVLDDATRADVARGFQEAVVETLAEKVAAGACWPPDIGGWWSPAAWARIGGCASGCGEIAQRAGSAAVFSARGVLHGQRRNDRVGRLLAFDAAGRARPRFGRQGALGTRRSGSTGVLSNSNG